MTRMMKADPADVPYPEDIRTDRRTIQRGSTNDPLDQDGILYLNAAKTAYLYLDGYDLYFQPPDSSPVKIN